MKIMNMTLLMKIQNMMILNYAGDFPPKVSKHPHELDETVGGIITSYIQISRDKRDIQITDPIILSLLVINPKIKSNPVSLNKEERKERQGEKIVKGK